MSLTTADLNTIIKKVVLAYSAVSPAKRHTLVSTFREVHRRPDTNTETTPEATDEATLYALLIALKTLTNTHFAAATYHLAADSVNLVEAADSTSEATAITLVNELKADSNAHMIEGGVHMVDDMTNRITIADAVDLASCYLLANQIRTKWNAHLSQETDGRWLNIKAIVDAAEQDATAGSGVTRDEIRSQIRALIPDRPGEGTSQFTISIVEAGAADRVSPKGENYVDEADNLVIAIDNGFLTWLAVLVDNVSLESGGSYDWGTYIVSEGAQLEFVNVTESHTVLVTYLEETP